MGKYTRDADMALSVAKRIVFPEITRVAVHVTYDCNQHCKTCDIWKINKDNPELKKTELCLEEFQEFCNKNPRILWMCLTGGEPYLKKDLKGFIDACLTIPSLRLISISTNGSAPEKIESDVRHFIASGRKDVTLATQVSFEGDEELHNKVCGTPGSYRRAIDSLGRLKRLASQDTRIRWGLAFTLSYFNQGGFVPMLRSLPKDLIPPPGQIQVSFGQRADYYHWTEDRRVEPDRDTWDKEVKNLMSLTAWGNRLKDPYSMVEYLYYRKAMQLRNGDLPPRCVACQYSVTIDPYWGVHPCLFKFGISLGNLKDNGYKLKELVDSTRGMWAPMVDECVKTTGCWTLCEDYMVIVARPWRVL